MDNHDVTWIRDSLQRVEGNLEALRKDVSDIRELVYRHDEQLRANQARQTWLGGIVAAIVAMIIKDRFHIF